MVASTGFNPWKGLMRVESLPDYTPQKASSPFQSLKGINESWKVRFVYDFAVNGGFQSLKGINESWKQLYAGSYCYQHARGFNPWKGLMRVERWFGLTHQNSCHSSFNPWKGLMRVERAGGWKCQRMEFSRYRCASQFKKYHSGYRLVNR